jgi:hypothetical protein
LQFVNVITDGVSKPRVKITKDYVDPAAGSQYTNYAHGVNIGYIVGHVDGSVANSYVYNGHLHLNTSDETYTKVKHESENGLIGEIGINIKNEFSPASNYQNAGDTGVINFTSIYDSMRVSDAINDTLTNNGITFYSYTLTNGASNLYSPYLRTAASGDYITGSTNSVDFNGHKYISDTDALDLGLGIFDMSTSDYDNDSTQTIHDRDYLNGIGEYKITRMAADNYISSLYYSTAEYKYDFTKDTDVLSSLWKNDAKSKYGFYDGAVIPSCVDSNFWTAERERKWNYFFKVNLTDQTTMNNSNYFYNTDSTFLQEYFKYKLIDKSGHSIAPGSSKFGIYLKDVVNDSIININPFKSYLTLANSGDNFSTFTTTKNGASFVTPVKTIGFNISTSDYANVTIVAGNYDANDNYVGIYRRDDIVTSPISLSSKRPAYAMYVPGNNIGVNGFKYFTYDNVTGATSTVSTFEAESGALFAHTFKLPRGQYYVGSPSGSGRVNIYYIAAQGQENANAGEGTLIFNGNDSISNFDFLLYDPKATTFAYDATSIASERAYFYLNLIYNNILSASLDVETNDVSHEIFVTIDTSLTSSIVDNSNSYYFTFNNKRMNSRYYVYPEV